MFMLWNGTDRVFASPEEFETEGAAEAYADSFRARYQTQGYYKTAGGERIAPEDVVLMVVPEDPQAEW
jgi:hypothetical protein